MPLVVERHNIALQEAFGEGQMSYILKGQLCHTKKGGWAMVGARPKVDGMLSKAKIGPNDRQFMYHAEKARTQPLTGGKL